MYTDQVQDAIRGARRIWVTFQSDARHWRIGGVEQETLPAAGYLFCGEVERNEAVTLRLFAHEPDIDPMVFSEVENSDQRVQVYTMIDPVVRGNWLEMNVGWLVPNDTLPGQHSLGIHVENADGVVVQQADYGLADVGFGCAYPNFAMDDLSPGDYSVRVTVYRWENGEWLLVDEEARPVIGTFRVQ